MPLFLGVHKIPEGLSEEQIKEGWLSYCQSSETMGLKPLSVIYSLEKRFAYCQTEAETSEQVRQAHQSVALPLEEVVEVKRVG